MYWRAGRSVRTPSGSIDEPVRPDRRLDRRMRDTRSRVAAPVTGNCHDNRADRHRPRKLRKERASLSFAVWHEECSVRPWEVGVDYEEGNESVGMDAWRADGVAADGGVRFSSLAPGVGP